MSNTTQKLQAALTSKRNGIKDAVRMLQSIALSKPVGYYSDEFRAFNTEINSIDDKIQELYKTQATTLA